MLGRLILLLTIVPLTELILLLEVKDRIGWPETLTLVIVTGVVGAALARHEGTRAWRGVQAELAAGKLPGAPLVDALLIFVAGALLVTPGILTDLVGFSLLIPWTRARVRRYLRTRFESSITVVRMDGYGPSGPAGPPRRDDLIDVEARSGDGE